jgi:hypothetical protein
MYSCVAVEDFILVINRRWSENKNKNILYRVIHKSVKHFKNSQKKNKTTQLIMVILTPIERETLKVFLTYFTDVQCVHLW